MLAILFLFYLKILTCRNLFIRIGLLRSLLKWKKQRKGKGEEGGRRTGRERHRDRRVLRTAEVVHTE